MLAERTLIELDTSGITANAEEQLRKVFAGVIADHQEGVVLKAAGGGYNDPRSPWVKVSVFLIFNVGILTKVGIQRCS